MKILFVCTANISRSPSAECVLRHLALQAGKNVQVRSAGVTDFGSVHTEAMRSALIKAGFDPGPQPRPSEPLADEHIEWADLVVVMEQRHLQCIVARHGEPRNFTLFMELAGEGDFDTPDPYAGDCEPQEFLAWAMKAAGNLLKKIP
jgi:protein-tyrosine-phosphatase